MKLNIKDRIYLPQVLAKNYSLIEGQTKRQIIEKTQFTEEEVEECGFSTENGMTFWKKEKEIEVELSHAQIAFLKKSVEALDQQSAITDEVFPLCEKIMAL